MAVNKNQKIKNIQGSTVFQVESQIVYNGITPLQAIEISRDVVKQELAILTERANILGVERLENIIERVVERINEVNPALFDRFSEPAIQFALNETYKEYVKTGDEELTDLHIDVMVDRLEVGEKLTEQYVIDEAQKMLPKLTISTLSCLAFLVYLHLLKHNIFKTHILKLNPFIDEFKFLSMLEVNYMRQIGCIYISEEVLFSSLEEFVTVEYKEILYYGLYFHLDPLRALKRKSKLSDPETLDAELDRVSNTVLGDLKDKIEFVSAYKLRKEIGLVLAKINPSWVDVLRFYEPSFTRCHHFTPAGLYLGLKYLNKFLDVGEVALYELYENEHRYYYSQYE